MSDKLSSPSASSLTSHGTQTPKSRGGNGDEPYLVFRQQPPTHVYSNESFEIVIELEIPKALSPSASGTDGELLLQASLQNLKSGRPTGSEATLIVEPSRIVLDTRGGSSKRQCKLRCMIRSEPVQRDKGAAFVIQISPRIDVDQPIKAVAIASTSAIHIVNYKTKITMEDDWEHIWYKDEGGRDKCMEIFAAIYDGDDQVRTGEQIPLQLTLVYNADDDEIVKVTNQEILRTLGSAKIVIDKSTGKARIRFRIEDVSKNHQGQDFKLEVSPDPKAKGFKDVAPGYTPAVSVRSKRNKRTRNSSGGGSRTGSNERRASPVPGRPRPMYEEVPVHPREIAFEGIDVDLLREAMKGVINWTDEVVNGLYPLQWQVLGYAQNPDGGPDYSRPYHNMPNPNACISRILSMYSDSTRENLRVLLNAVEQTSPSRPDESPYGGMTASLPREPDERYGMMRGPMPMHGQASLPPQATGQRLGLHPSVASEAFREKSPQASMYYQPHPSATPPHQQQMPYHRPRPGPQRMVEDNDPMQMHDQVVPAARTMPRGRMDSKPPGMPVQRTVLPGYDEEESRESEVEYVLAKQYKALRTGERLGFPAYSHNKEILGFYRESSTKVGVGQFIPISRHRNEFGPLEIMQATEILEDSIVKKSEAVHELKDWGSIANLMDHALVYDWSKDIGNDPSNSGSV